MLLRIGNVITEPVTRSGLAGLMAMTVRMNALLSAPEQGLTSWLMLEDMLKFLEAVVMADTPSQERARISHLITGPTVWHRADLTGLKKAAAKGAPAGMKRRSGVSAQPYAGWMFPPQGYPGRNQSAARGRSVSPPPSGVRPGRPRSASPASPTWGHWARRGRSFSPPGGCVGGKNPDPGAPRRPPLRTGLVSESISPQVTVSWCVDEG